jgi:8-oxo-dGTP diphosphatase
VLRRVIAALLVRDGKILIAKRNAHDRLANMWEFPGGKVEPGESPEVCLKREIREELQIDITVGDLFGEIFHNNEHGSIRLIAYWATCDGFGITPVVHDAYAWVALDELDNYEFVPADMYFVKRLKHTTLPI